MKLTSGNHSTRDLFELSYKSRLQLQGGPQHLFDRFTEKGREIMAVTLKCDTTEHTRCLLTTEGVCCPHEMPTDHT